MCSNASITEILGINDNNLVILGNEKEKIKGIELPRCFYCRDVSLLSSQSVRNNNPPAMRVRDRCYTKKSPFRSIIELFKLNNTNRKVILWLIKRTAYLTQNGCANII